MQAKVNKQKVVEPALKSTEDDDSDKEKDEDYSPGSGKEKGKTRNSTPGSESKSKKDRIFPKTKVLKDLPFTEIVPVELKTGELTTITSLMFMVHTAPLEITVKMKPVTDVYLETMAIKFKEYLNDHHKALGKKDWSIVTGRSNFKKLFKAAISYCRQVTDKSVAIYMLERLGSEPNEYTIECCSTGGEFKQGFVFEMFVEDEGIKSESWSVCRIEAVTGVRGRQPKIFRLDDAEHLQMLDTAVAASTVLDTDDDHSSVDSTQ